MIIAASVGARLEALAGAGGRPGDRGLALALALALVLIAVGW